MLSLLPIMLLDFILRTMFSKALEQNLTVLTQCQYSSKFVQLETYYTFNLLKNIDQSAMSA